MRGPRGILRSLLGALTRSGRIVAPVERPDPGSRADALQTREVTPPAAADLTISYAPDRDGDPDGGEIVWTWVPYVEQDGRGKDRPVLVLGPASGGRVYAVKLTSKPREGDADAVALGAGPWDARGRPSWVDLDQVYVVHPAGMRREAAALDRERFARVAEILRRRYGWRSDVS